MRKSFRCMAIIRCSTPDSPKSLPTSVSPNLSRMDRKVKGGGSGVEDRQKVCQKIEIAIRKALSQRD